MRRHAAKMLFEYFKVTGFLATRRERAFEVFLDSIVPLVLMIPVPGSRWVLREKVN